MKPWVTLRSCGQCLTGDDPRPRPELSEEGIDAFLGGRDPAEAFLDTGPFSALRRRLDERAPGTGLDVHLEHEDSGNTRNGRNRTTVHTEHCGMPNAVPRER